MSHSIRTFASRFGMSGALVLLAGLLVIHQPAVRAGGVPAGAAAVSVKFTVLNTCGAGTFSFSVAGTSVGTINSGSDCTCTPAERSITSTDPAVLALLSDGCSPVNVSFINQSSTYVAWAKADITRADGSNQKACILDTNGGDCSVADLCAAGYTNYGNPQTFTAAAQPADTDGDTIADCTDPDLDNDGVLNGADNCPVTANASQADANADGVGDACQPVLAAVPWFGQESQPHQVYSGGSLVLQAVFGMPDGTPMPLTSAVWDPGDGSAPVTVSASNPRILERTHTYTGTEGQPFVATITATDPAGKVYTDTFRVVIKANTRETRVNMAIDKGLWNLHKNMTMTTSDGLRSGFWTAYGYPMTTTASSVQAFQINGHRESGDPLKDPYVTTARLGMRYILSDSHGALKRLDVPVQNGNDPDANGNGYGLWVDQSGHASYLTGQLIDAIVSSGTPNAQAPTGVATYVRGRAYRDIVQDLLDGYSYGMADNTGGWYYSYQGTTGNNDTSASHWWAIGVLAAENWGLDAPAWVKNIQWTIGVPLMQNASTGVFGYTNNQSPLWDSGYNTTAAGLVLMNADDISKTNARYVAAVNFMNTNFNSTLGNYYSMYQLTKAMRTAHNDAGAVEPIELLAGSRDWYAAYADYLVSNQSAVGAFTSTVGTAGTQIQGDMASSWAIIMLSPSLFQLPPTAACSVDSAIVCQAGAVGGCNPTGGDLYATVNFSGNASLPGDNPIAGYEWNFTDGTSASGATASHSFSSVGTFNVALTVTDTKGASSTVTCPVVVTSTAVPPVANAGGPYDVCPNRNPSVLLNGTGSIERGSAIVLYEWDWVAPLNFAAPNATTATTDQTAFFSALPVGTYDVGLRVTDDTPTNEGGPFRSTTFTTVNVRAANDPACNQVPVATPNAYTIPRNGSISDNLTANGDADPDGDTFTASLVGPAPAGTFSLAANGSFSYAPPTGFDGTVTFQYRLTDQFGGNSAPVTVTITVVPNVDPVAQPDAATTFSGTPVTITVLSNDSDADAGQTISVTSTSGGPSDGSVTVNPDGTITYTPNLGFAGTNTFTYAISDGNGGAATALVTVVVTKRTATVTAGSGTKVYGTADPTLTASSTGFLVADNIEVSMAARDAGEAVDTYATHATASGATLANYEVTYEDGTLTITPAAPAVSVTGGAFTYNGNAQTGTCTVTGVGTDALTGVLTYSSGTEPVAAGTYTATCTVAATQNYSAATGEATITIGKAPATVTAGSGTKVYGTSDPTLTPTATGFLPTDGIVVTQAARAAGESVDTYATSATVAGDALVNYDVEIVDGTFTITPATPVVAAADVTVVYDGQPHPATCSFAGVGEDVLTGTTTYSGGSAPVAAGTYTATCTFEATQNYSGATSTATITITKAPLSVVANSYTRSYLAADPVLTGTLTGVISGDGITATYSSTGTGSQVPGVYPTVPALVDPNNKLGNYDVSSTNGTLTITNAAPVCTAATASPASIWPPNHQWVKIGINGVTDVDGGALTFTIVSIFQDEPTNTKGDGNTAIDGRGVGSNTAWVRAERIGDRSGHDHRKGDKCDHEQGKKGHRPGDNCEHERDEDRGNGRVYHITFTATDSLGLSCTGVVTVGVPHDRGGRREAIDDGPLYDSTVRTTPSGHHDNDDCRDGDHEHGKKDRDEDRDHYDGDKCDHDKGGKGHKKGDNCQHEKDVKDARDRNDKNKRDEDEDKGKKGKGN